jgi:hypothetical protein
LFLPYFLSRDREKKPFFFSLFSFFEEGAIWDERQERLQGGSAAAGGRIGFYCSGNFGHLSSSVSQGVTAFFLPVLPTATALLGSLHAKKGTLRR